MLRVGVIGLGYWGPNLVRAFDGLPDARVTRVSDSDPSRVARTCARFDVAGSADAHALIAADDVDAVVVATPTRSHHRLALEALEAGKHVFVEKPLAASTAECEELVERAEAKGAVLFTGHIFLYTAAVRMLKEIVDGGELGDLAVVTAARRNLGPIRADVNALWDLAPHDISIILHLLGESPTSVNCQGLDHIRPGLHDVCILTMHFPCGVMAVVHSSWLDPNKVRQMTLVGSRQMAVYDDIEPLEKIRLYDKGVEGPAYHTDFGEFPLSYRYGDTRSPYLVEEEPLKAEARHFVDCALRGTAPRSDGRGGLEVVRILEAADRSLAAGGGRILLDAERPARVPALALAGAA